MHSAYSLGVRTSAHVAASLPTPLLPADLRRMTDHGASDAHAHSLPLAAVSYYAAMNYYEVAGHGALRRARAELTDLLEGSLK
ncbi:hypothetical protein [Rhodococcus spongiicola]|uniref:hypothetical protein n=1 Tax=Rhodococcus spongiicola TaxID=2487352 RepID=UPI001F26C784|nr:hypothetical protein [Rhodococcus spongiicola]